VVGRASAIEESWSNITGVLKECVVVVGSRLALTVIEESATEESWGNITGVLKEGDVLGRSSLSLAAIEESWTGMLKGDVVVVGDCLALAATEES